MGRVLVKMEDCFSISRLSHGAMFIIVGDLYFIFGLLVAQRTSCSRLICWC